MSSNFGCYSQVRPGVYKTSQMLKTVDEDEKVQINTRNIITGKGNPVKWFLTEDGLYEVLMQNTIVRGGNEMLHPYKL